MLSILIPTYNYNCSPLVFELHEQLLKSQIPFEILLMEDGSKLYLKENQELTKLENVHHIILAENIGRSAIRNKMAMTAQYEWLIFMDCDSRIPYPEYIANYIANIQDDTRTVVCGGRILKPFAEVTPDYYLHWFYGTLREPDASKDNIEKPFLSNNFLIHRSVFESVCFEEKLKKYGHEDTLFGFQLTRQNFKIKYINNPVTHEGLDSNDQFIEKTTKSVANLYFLKKEFLLKEECSKIKLLNAASQIESCGLTHLIAKLHSFSGPVLLKQLKNKKPRLILLDLYKLGLFCSIIVSDRK